MVVLERWGFVPYFLEYNYIMSKLMQRQDLSLLEEMNSRGTPPTPTLLPPDSHKRTSRTTGSV